MNRRPALLLAFLVACQQTPQSQETPSDPADVQVAESAVTTNPAQPALPAGAQAIYTDGLAATWLDWSWGLTSNTQQTTTAMGTRAMKVVFGSGAGVKFAHADASYNDIAIASGAYAAVSFFLNPGSSTTKLANLAVTLENSAPQVNVKVSTYATLTANAWTQVRIPLSALNPSGASFHQIELVNADGATLFIDAVWLEAAVPAPVITSFKATPASLTQGQSTVLSWSATNATSYKLNGAAVSGTSATLTPSATTTYTLQAIGAGGTASASTTVTVTAPPPQNPAQPTPPAGALSVYADALAAGFYDWSWSTTNTEQSTIAMGTKAKKIVFGAGAGVKLQRADASGNEIALSGYDYVTLHLNPGATTTSLANLALSLENSSPQVNVKVSSYATLAANTWTKVRIPLSALNPSNAAYNKIELVNADGATLYLDGVWLEASAPTVTIASFTASPSSITQGASTTLSWSVQNATSVTLNGTTIATTSVAVSPSATTTYTLVANGNGGPKSASLTVTVNPAGIYCGSSEKIDLWRGTTKLRGANIMYEYTGGAVWPSYTQADLNLLASWGANYVEISGAGIFQVASPYGLEAGAAAELLRVLDMIYAARMWAVIAFRSGPGRPEETFLTGATPAPPLWTNGTAQTAWTNMWKETATRFRNHPALAGYKIMVEPDTSNGALWQTMASNIVTGIRSIDTKTPIMVGGYSWEGISSLSNIPAFSDTRIVYSFHQYEPFDYTTNQTAGPPTTAAMKAIFDPAVAFQTNRGNVPMVMSEFGIKRGSTGAATVLAQAYVQAERMKAATAIWLWQSPNEIYWYQQNPWTVQFLGTDMQNVIKTEWAKNTCRPN